MQKECSSYVLKTIEHFISDVNSRLICNSNSSEFLSFFARLQKYSTVNPVYSERVGAAKSVHNNRVFTINVFNLTIN
jgi:hypothetical protein